MKNTILYLLLCLVVLPSAFAQEDAKKKDWGYVTGSLESNNHVYVEDVANNFYPSTHPQLRDGNVFASNDYLKLDYYNDKFSAGLQLEAYAPVLVGYPSDLKGAGLTNYYVKWSDDDFSVTAGSFYEQFGSGLLFRSWEDRALGLNNAIMGARVTYSCKDILSLKALWGMPRFGMKFSQTQVKGADASFAVSNLAGWQNIYWALEASVLDRYEALDDKMILDGCSLMKLTAEAEKQKHASMQAVV